MPTRTAKTYTHCGDTVSWDDEDGAWVNGDGDLRCHPWDADSPRHEVTG